MNVSTQQNNIVVATANPSIKISTLNPVVKASTISNEVAVDGNQTVLIENSKYSGIWGTCGARWGQPNPWS